MKRARYRKYSGVFFIGGILKKVRVVGIPYPFDGALPGGTS